MEQTHEGLISVEPDYPQREESIRMPVPPISDNNAADVDDPAVKRLIRKINREHCAVIRLLKGSLTAMLRAGAALAEARGILGSTFPHWVQTKLPLTTAEADLLVRFFVAESGIREKDLSPTREMKLSRLVELLEELVGMWHNDDLADKLLDTAERDFEAGLA